MVLARRRAVASCFFFLTLSTAVAAPLPTRDQNPLLAGFGLPRPLPTRIDQASQWRLGADFNWGSSATIQNGSRERLIVDAETRDLRVTLDGNLSDRLAMAISLPYRSTRAGSLDGFINGWHDFFGLPTGARDQLPQNGLRVFYEREGVTLFDRRESLSGVGDVTVAAGWQLLNVTQSATMAWLELKLPTGSSTDLTGSEAFDFSTIVTGEHRFAGRWSVFGQASVTRLGGAKLLPDLQRTWVGSAMAGVSRSVWRTLELTMQLDAHTAVFDSQLDYLNEAVILNLGGTRQLDSGWRLSLGVSEDLLVEASPDVVFVFGVSRVLSR